MKLSDYLKSKKLSQYDFADMVKVSQAAVQRYANGKRIPEAEVMPRIHNVTNGQVTANDFYGLAPEKNKPEHRSN